MALWIKGKYELKDYSIENFKRCLDGIRNMRIWLALLWALIWCGCMYSFILWVGVGWSFGLGCWSWGSSTFLGLCIWVVSCVGCIFKSFLICFGFYGVLALGWSFHFMGSCLSGLGFLDFFMIFLCLSWVSLFVLSLKVLVMYGSMHIIHVWSCLYHLWSCHMPFLCWSSIFIYANCCCYFCWRRLSEGRSMCIQFLCPCLDICLGLPFWPSDVAASISLVSMAQVIMLSIATYPNGLDGFNFQCCWSSAVMVVLHVYCCLWSRFQHLVCWAKYENVIWIRLPFIRRSQLNG